MADPILQKLDAISQPGTSAVTFLKKLGPIHNNWHVAHNSGTSLTGFLLFHWELIQRFKKVGGPAHFGGVVPFTMAQLAADGADYNVNVAVRKDNVSSLEDFSSELEVWHNNAHMAIGMHFHINLMNPKTNVRLVQFWQLHFFINDRFEEALATFSPGTAVPTVVAQLEAGPAAAAV